MARTLGLLVVVSASVGCGGMPSEVCTIPPDEQRRVARGDVNADGALDVSDVVYLQRHAFTGGAAPPCRDAAEVVSDGVIDAADASTLWLHLVGSSALEPLSDFSCLPPLTFPAAPACGRVGVELEAPGKVSGTGTAPFQAVVSLKSPDLEVHGWSLSVSVEGACAMASATASGTVAADGWVDDQGLRRLGMASTGLTTDGSVAGAVSLVVLDRLGAGLPPGRTATPVLTLDIEGTVPPSGCEECRIFLDDGRRGSGPPVSNVITHQGFGYAPELAEVTVAVCAG